MEILTTANYELPVVAEYFSKLTNSSRRILFYFFFLRKRSKLTVNLKMKGTHVHEVMSKRARKEITRNIQNIFRS